MMEHLFKELEELGIHTDMDIKIYNKVEKKPKKPVINPELVKEIVYQRKVTCPVCDTEFMTTSVRAGRIRFVDTELDLRPIYKSFDPVPYDVVACPMCGYAHLNKYFSKISDIKIGKVKEQIAVQFKGKHYPMVYTYQDGIERYKLALLNCVVGLDNNGMKAYLCLKISWLYRGYRLKLEAEETYEASKIFGLRELEREFSAYAYEGFVRAYEHESFPVMGIEQNSLEYLLAELARRQGDFKNAKKWLSRVIGKQNTKRFNDKIFEVKEKISNSRMD